MAQACASKFRAVLAVLNLIAVFTSVSGVLTQAQNSLSSPSKAPNIVMSGPLLSSAVTYDSGGFEAYGIAVGDVNGDGKPDLVVTNWCIDETCQGGSIAILLGNGDGTFGSPLVYEQANRNPRVVAVADVNNDGKADIIVGFFSGEFGVLLGNGDGTFQGTVFYSAGFYADFTSLVVADVNRDGKPDVIVSAGRGVQVFLGNGDGTFQPGVAYTAGEGPWSVAIADVNGDGILDLLATDSAPGWNTVAGLLGNGDGTFRSASTYSSGGAYPLSIAVADVSGDHKPDVVVGNWGSSVAVLLGNGDGTFQPPVSYDSGPGPVAVAIADLNGDGKPDVISLNDGNYTVGVLVGNGDGTFQPKVLYGTGGGEQVGSVAVVDLNGDGSPDVVASLCSMQYCSEFTSHGGVAVLLNNTPFCTTAPAVTVSAAPSFLWPPTGGMVPVTFSGTITNSQTGCSIENAAFVVKDEYNKVQPSGPLTFGPGGAFSFTVPLQASRLGSDLDGRQYTITVGASNNVGKTGAQNVTVMVPHDQRR